jgi:lipoprotein-anchoring transpeptidase ErfK/SrfK
MKRRLLVAGGTTLAVLLVVGGGGGASALEAHAYSNAAAQLQSTWRTDESNGVPAQAFASWSAQVSAWQSRWALAPAWLWANGQSEINDLKQQTDALYARMVAADRAAATKGLAALQTLLGASGPWITVQDTAAASNFKATLTTASTPKTLSDLGNKISATTTAVNNEIAQRQASFNADIADRGGAPGVLTAAAKDIATAQADTLDVGNVPALLANAQALGVGDKPTQAVVLLDQALPQLEARIQLNNQLSTSLKSRQWDVDAALAESTPNAGSLQSQYNAAIAAFKAASTDAQLTAVSGQFTALQNATTAELNANQCGHNVGSGKVITLSLSLQEAVFYQDGCVAQATPITTGRPALPTPTGTFHVFYKTTPFEMISPWPQGSPFYYNPTWVKWVMEFDSGGYFLHDAYWEPLSDYGPGGEFTGGASHGCVHIPTSTMQWAYSWTPSGTPVIISN